MAFKATCTCLAKVAPDEPIFVLRAQDTSAPSVVLEWVKQNPHISQKRREEAF